MVNFRNAFFSALLIGLAGAAVAGDEAKMNIAIEVLGEDGVHGRHFMFNGADFGFDLDEMQVGESRSIVDESGRAILVTRGEEGFSLNIDGETIELPHLAGGEHGGMHWAGDGEGSNVSIHVMHDANFTTTNEMSGTMIVSPKPIDDATQQAIKSLLESGGYGSDVNFIDHEGAEHGKVMIRKVKRVVENPQT